MNIPLPKVVADVEAGGPFITAAKGKNALRKLQAEAEYAPYTNYANALSKAAYAQTAPAAALATFMSGPGAANLTSDQAQALATQMQNYLKQPSMVNSIPAPNSSFGGGLIGNAFRTLLNKVSSGSGNAMNQMPVSQQQIPQQQSSPDGLDVAPKLDNEGRIPVVPPSPPAASTVTSGTGVGALPFTRKAASYAVPGTQSGGNPATSAEAQKQSTIEGAKQEVAVQSDMWKAMHTNAAQAAINTQKTTDLANEFSDAYDRTNEWQKGPVKGSIPPWFSEAAHTADTASNAMADSVARAQQEGHITSTDRQTYQSMKPNRSMRPETKENSIAFINGMNQRIQENAAFLVEAQKKGLTPQEANAIWINYIKNNPFYSAKEHKLLGQNFNRWPKYLTDEKIQEALHPVSGEGSGVSETPEASSASPAVKSDGRGVKILSKGLVIPTFSAGDKGKSEFQAWYSRQPVIVQKAVTKHLGGK